MASVKTTTPKGVTVKNAQVKGGTFEPMDKNALAKGGTIEPMDKNVNHPTRYTKGAVECIDAMDAAVVGKPPDEAICVSNVIRYLWRYEEKEPLRSLKSAEWYLKRLIAKVEKRCDNGQV